MCFRQYFFFFFFLNQSINEINQSCHTESTSMNCMKKITNVLFTHKWWLHCALLAAKYRRPTRPSNVSSGTPSLWTPHWTCLGHGVPVVWILYRPVKSERSPLHLALVPTASLWPGRAQHTGLHCQCHDSRHSLMLPPCYRSLECLYAQETWQNRRSNIDGYVHMWVYEGHPKNFRPRHIRQ